MIKILLIEQEEINLDLDLLRKIITPEKSIGKFAENIRDNTTTKYCIFDITLPLQGEKITNELINLINFINKIGFEGFNKIMLIYERRQTKFDKRISD